MLPLAASSLWAWLAAGVGAQDQPAALEPTPARLQAAYADAVAACSKALGGPLDPPVPLRFVDAEAIGAIVARENLPVVRLRQPDAAMAAAEAKLLGDQLARHAFAKYSWSERSVVAVTASWRAFAADLEQPALLGDDCLRAAMVHELCHAYDDRRFGLAARLQKATSVEAQQAFNAVLEGHAQLQARRVCAQSGWSAGFDAMRQAVVTPPPKVAAAGEAALQRARAAAAAVRFTYHAGEDFVAAVLAADPDRGAHRVFHEPPVDRDAVLQPRRYLDGSPRPVLRHDLEPALDRAAAWLGEDAWQCRRTTATAQQLAAALTLLPPADVEAFVASLRQARVLQAASKIRPQAQLAVLGAMEFASEAAAARWLQLAQQLSDRKDAARQHGAARIVSSRATPLPEDGDGFLVAKRLAAGDGEYDVAAITVRRGCVVVETVFSGLPPDDDAHKKLVREMLDAVVAKAVPPAPAPKTADGPPK